MHPHLERFLLRMWNCEPETKTFLKAKLAENRKIAIVSFCMQFLALLFIREVSPFLCSRLFALKWPKYIFKFTHFQNFLMIAILRTNVAIAIRIGCISRNLPVGTSNLEGICANIAPFENRRRLQTPFE